MPQHRRRIIILSYLSFLTLGLGGSAIGPSLPTLAGQVDVGLDAVGGLVSSLSVGYLIAGLVAGLLIDTIGRRPVYLAALGMQAFSLPAILGAPSLTMEMLAAFFLGLGQGGIDVVVHVVMGDGAGQDRGASLNRLHVLFGVGALIGPALTGYGLTALGSLWPAFGFIAALTFLLALGVALTPLPTQSLTHRSAASSGARAIVSDHAFWALGAFFFLYVGLEVGLGTWTFAFLSEGLGAEVTLASWAASGFYLALTGGRLLGSRLVGRRVADEKVVLTGVGGGVVGGLLLVTGGALSAVPLLIVAVLLVGFCFGPIYPTTMGIAQRRYPGAAGTAVGLLTAGAGLGATSFPWIQGRLLARGGLSWGVAATGAGALALLAVAMAAIPQRIKS
jgi:fucose permease